MPSDLKLIQSAIDAWPGPPGDIGPATDAGRRFCDALNGLRNGTSGVADLASLARQVLIEDSEQYGGAARLVIPAARPWPDLTTWESVSCVVSGKATLTVRAVDWVPPEDYRREATRRAESDVRSAYSTKVVGSDSPVQGDPFWAVASSHPNFSGAAQRNAARAAVTAPEGSTLVVVLPTGRGKTAVAWARALLRQTGLTVIVVPTVVLALDMERRTREESVKRKQSLSPVNRFAYIGDLPETAKKELRDAVRTGQQRILYASPEALVTGLASALIDCAALGLLNEFVIDEAHIVDQWGQDFRPEFQSMAGLRSLALERAPMGRRPVTILMSATLTGRQIELLTTLFPGVNETEVVWGSSLRCEPAYFIESCETAELRAERVLEAVRRLPRPLLLYATLPEDAENWVRRIQGIGFQRVAAVTGNSNADSRRSVLERWRGTDTAGDSLATTLDIVVGTSAFGLGIDMPNVRTVIHACVPETIDRFYQEVGRTGRDGRASVSYLVPFMEKSAPKRVPDDGSIARRLNNVVTIGVEKGWKRWASLRDSGGNPAPGVIRVDTSTLPVHLSEGFGQSAQWNIRTLTLMARAGIVKLQAPEVSLEDSSSLTPEERDRLYAEAFAKLDVELLDGSALTEAMWGRRITAVKGTIADAQRESLERMWNLMKGEVCVGELLAEHYTAPYDGGLLSTPPSCRGCPACRKGVGTGIAQDLDPGESLPWRSSPDPLVDLRGRSEWVYVWWRDDAERLDLAEEFAARLVSRGVMVVHTEDEAMARRIQTRGLPTPVIHDRDGSLLNTFHGPVLVLLGAGALSLDPVVVERARLGAPTYVVGPPNLSDSAKPQWLVRDLAEQSMTLRAAWGKI